MQFPQFSNEVIPKKVEWALINKQKADQYERLKQVEKIKDREKKERFKNQLDNQINGKNNVHKIEKEQDKKYYDFISMKAEEMKQKQLKEKYDKMNRRRTVEEENQYLLYQNTMSKSRNSERQENTKTSLDIGIASAKQRERIQSIGKKIMQDSLDKQLQMKTQEMNKEKVRNLRVQQQNKMIQEEYFMNRNRNTKKYGQNPNVYNYYQELSYEKERREKQLEYMMIDDAALKKQQEDFKRRSDQEHKKQFLEQQMKQTLDRQVQFHNYQKQQETRINPQENSYQVIGSMFRQRDSPYDKRQYFEYLKRQAEHQKWKKNADQHMSQEEYKFNLNQLNKAVTGTYAQENYQDRSLIAIGEKQSKLNLNTHHDRQDIDQEIVMQKLQSLKTKRRNQSAQSKSIIS